MEREGTECLVSTLPMTKTETIAKTTRNILQRVNGLWKKIKSTKHLEITPPTTMTKTIARAIIHVCQFCQKKFPTLDQLQSHVNAKHIKKLLFKCSFCPMWRLNVVTHLKMEHRKDATHIIVEDISAIGRESKKFH